MEPKYFFNWTDKDVSFIYASEPWSFKAGEHMLLKPHLADFFASKLSDAEMQKDGLLCNDARRGEYIAKCFVAPADAPEIPSAEGASTEKLEAIILNAEDKRKRTPKKKAVEELEDGAFEGLKEDVQ